ncbi:hypothetical protein ACIBQ1_37940 [Nonomuraea sp. NPDC050153]|uniref:hypothetical protein n=1 Tax=Nonomuraea sp. NPDC050153 TaxID=3364359 RepID=UPI0037A18855
MDREEVDGDGPEPVVDVGGVDAGRWAVPVDEAGWRLFRGDRERGPSAEEADRLPLGGEECRLAGGVATWVVRVGRRRSSALSMWSSSPVAGA